MSGRVFPAPGHDAAGRVDGQRLADGIPVKVTSAELLDDGSVMITAEMPDGVQLGADLGGLSVAGGDPDLVVLDEAPGWSIGSADNRDYVNSRQAAGLGPAEIARKRHVPPPVGVRFSAALTGPGGPLMAEPEPDDVDDAQPVRFVANRADLRRLARRRRRG